ncbi:MAG: primosomal protein N' [Albidovulum sp.]|nr:primosomal protein N' [Albidovulum sp.]
MENQPNVSESTFREGELVSVLTTAPLDGCLDYRAPSGEIELGQFVEVPLGPRKVKGVVWGVGEGTVDPKKLKSVAGKLDIPPMRREMREFLERASAYTVTPLPAMLRLATRVSDLGSPQSTAIAYQLDGLPPARMTPARIRVIDTLRKNKDKKFGIGELAKRAGVSASVIRALQQAGTLRRIETPRETDFPELAPDFQRIELNEAQAAAAAVLRAGVGAGRFSATLLKGVTGSGKTEVYLEAVAEAIRRGRQSLVLLPEIALTSEFLKRVAAKFGALPGEWHSQVTQAERRRVWRKAADGSVQLVVGARSALYLPFRDLGLIVIDEEHDISYKQDDGILYNARDMAVLRASIAGAKIVLASATPSLETWANAGSGKYRRLDLPARFRGAALPEMNAVDMRQENLESGRWISGPLAIEMRSRLAIGEQSLLFLNRRGYAPVTVCRACGHQIGCKDCDARMVEHRFRNQLMCHQCGASTSIPSKCPSCEREGKLTPVGPGVERLTEEVKHLFPEARIAELSSDSASSALAFRELLDSISAGEADIVIGTQMAAKGHNFPMLTLVGVIDADLGLNGSDLRAAERTFQLMHQVAGRAGRTGLRGLALLQTWQPDHPVMQAILSGDDEGFWRVEAAEREVAGVPPFGRFAGIVVSGTNEAKVRELARDLVGNSQILSRIGAEVYGPAPAPIARIRGRVRFRILVKAAKTAPLQAALIRWQRQFKIPSGIRMSIDIDPFRFY